MATKAAGDDFSPYEANYTYTNMSPIIIRAYVREVSPEALVYKQYGLHRMGAKEIICELKYRDLFTNCNKVVIENDEYQVFREGVGSRALIQERPYNMMRVVLSKNG